MKQFFIFLYLVVAISGCVTNSYLRTSEVLPEGKWELLGGAAVNQTFMSPVALVGYGFTHRLDFSLRVESSVATMSPRYQVLHESRQGINLLLLLEAGTVTFNLSKAQIGTGIVLGKTLGHFEPYVSYVFRYGSWPSSTSKQILGVGGSSNTAHFVKMGTRFNIPDSLFFLQLEGGLSIWLLPGPSTRGAFPIVESAAGFGIKF